eukprot:CAMPEP_0196720690 /NCGR_PEP_ID=MMETSP1091-20130531/3423_1 /TAXON_ID=302021 /ORGANISM="Rhodomonas sp., Strain CCMP768" /LENGTH=45 /DNA_ID= /DNA_START= /DNA_END= /DNA_ORIENTATION=
MTLVARAWALGQYDKHHDNSPLDLSSDLTLHIETSRKISPPNAHE